VVDQLPRNVFVNLAFTVISRASVILRLSEKQPHFRDTVETVERRLGRLLKASCRICKPQRVLVPHLAKFSAIVLY